MAHSLFAPTPDNTIEDYITNNEYFHAASNTHYRMIRRGAEYFQLRWQIGYEGKETNFDEKRVDFVMGSGQHARTYLHRNARGGLNELPLGWYTEKGGYWAMSPGYDKPDHPAAGRAIGYDCMFCHNAYPEVPKSKEPLYTGAMPQGIDCARCHGPGEKHIQSAGRAAILNPAKLSPSRQMEVCMQCHLQPTSFPLPSIVKRDERPWFSYNPTEPLSAFLLYFDRAKPDDRFEIDSSAYRLRKSACFLQSKGALQCTTCHNPHQPHNTNYDTACKKCHATVASAKHPRADSCASCHMPRRRTDDVVNAVVTDHFIQRNPPANPPAHPYTSYRGPLVPYYPAKSIPHNISRLGEALPTDPDSAPLHNALGIQAAQAGDLAKAEAEFREAIRILPSAGDAHGNLANVLAVRGDDAQALYEFSESVRLVPAETSTRFRYASLLNATRQFALSKQQMAIVIAQQPKFAEAHDLLGNLFEREGNIAAATREYRFAVQLKPGLTQAQRDLAAMLVRK